MARAAEVGGRLRFNEIADALDLLDRAELRADQDLLKAQLRDAFDAPARFVRRADEIDRRHFCQLGGLRTLGKVDRAIGEDGIGAAGIEPLAADPKRIAAVLDADKPK